MSHKPTRNADDPIAAALSDGFELGLELPAATTPALLVRHTTLEGRKSAALLAAGPHDEVWLTVSGRPAQPLGTPDFGTALRLTRGWRELRPRRVTEIFVRPSVNLTHEGLLASLRIVQPTLLHENTDDFDLELLADATADLVDAVLEVSAEGLGTRFLAVNGEPIAFAKVHQRQRPALVPLTWSGWSWEVQLPVTWIRFVSCETASRVSGSCSWSVGQGPSGLVGTIEHLDEDVPRLELRTTRRSRLKEIVRGLQWVSEEADRDVVMLAVEQVTDPDLPDDLRSDYFDDVCGSPTDECSLDLDVCDDERDEFLALIRRAGRRDAVDAVLRPRSQAGRRRVQRIAQATGEPSGRWS